MNEINTQEEALSRLLRRVEEKVGREMKTPKDFDFLAAQIFEQTRRTISVSTLKRIWGYIDSYRSIRESTLDLLSQFVGYDNFRHFCQAETESTAEEKLPKRGRFGGGSSWKFGGGLLATLIAIAVLFFFVLKPFSPADRPILKCGQTFASYDEFLSLFNIHATDCQYFQPVPNCSVSYVWAPQYQHPVYHNEGNPDSLMPTITEYLSLKPLDDSPESRKLLLEQNRKCYLTAIRNNQVRVVFMKDLPGDTCFTFTGVYRVSYSLSDTTKVVWTRMSQECDLNHLEDLDRLRN